MPPSGKRKRSYSIPLLSVDVQNDGVHLVLKAKINNRVARLVLDTGASRTVLDKDRAMRFLKSKAYRKHNAISTGLGTASMESFVAELARFDIGKLTLRNYTAVFLDLSHVNQTLKAAGMKEIDGVLGGDILSGYEAVIDYAKMQLRLRDPG